MEAGNYENNIVTSSPPRSSIIHSFRAILFCVILFFELDTANTVHAYSNQKLSPSLAVPNDLSLTKIFLMHIFYFTSCNYDKLLKTVNATHSHTHRRRRAEKASAAWQNQRNQPPATKSLERIWPKVKQRSEEKKIGTKRERGSKNITKRELLVDGRVWRNREKNWEWKLFRVFKAMNWKWKKTKKKTEWIMKTDVEIRVNRIEGQRACYNKPMCNTTNNNQTRRNNAKEKLNEQTNVTLVHSFTFTKTILATPIWLLQCRYVDRKKKWIYEMCRPIITWICNFEYC